MENQKKILLSTSFLPSIDYMACICNYPDIIIDMHEHYTKQSWRNRARIYAARGALDLSLPVVKSKGNHTPVKDVGISYQENWPVKYWRAIESAYNASPYFMYYQDEIESVFKSNNDSLIQYNTELLKVVCELIELDVNIYFTEEFVPYEFDEENDLRVMLHPKKQSILENFPSYQQVFAEQYGFISNLSILDLLMNMGPESISYLESVCKLNMKELSKF